MPTTADLLIERLADWGVDVVFGLPGDGISGIMNALRTHQDRVRFIQVRHEESAAFMACAYAKFTGRVGVCLGTSGPGGIHLANGLYDAAMDGQPVLALTGDTFHDLLGTWQQQDVDLARFYAPMALYSQRVSGPAHVVNAVDQALRLATTRRGVVHLSIPTDTQRQEADTDARSERNVPGHSAVVSPGACRLPSQEQIAAAAAVLNEGSRVAILAGRGALAAGPELEQAAELLGAPIIKALLGKACVPDDSPYTTGGIGLLGTTPSVHAMQGCDTLLIVGSSFPYLDYYPKPGQARCVQIDIDPARIGARYPVDVPLAGNARDVLRALLPLLRPKADRSFLERAQREMADWWRLVEDREARQDVPMKPQVSARALNDLLSDDAIVVTDSGTIATWAARSIRIRGRQMFSLSGNLATMACGLPYALGAQVAYPGRQVVCLIGDGAFSMLMADMATAVKYNLPVKILIFKNNYLGEVRWEQLVLTGYPEFGVDLQPIDFAMAARAMGAAGFRIEQPQQARSTMAEALAHPGPAVIEAVIDPNEPPMPPNFTIEQGVHFAEALIKGQPQAVAVTERVAVEGIRQVAETTGAEAVRSLRQLV
jgi:thiamine pyrophosphate-dependent acetolactate synthase large subunit-like protein